MAGADVDERAELGPGTVVWHLAQVRENARIGVSCIIGRGVYIGAGVRIGDRTKVQNHALIYEPADISQDVFVGPAAVLTNDRFPRSVNADGKPKGTADWEPVAVTVAQGASIGARAVCVAPVSLGRWSMVAAGAVVTKDVPDFALVAGVPARRVGWVGRAGRPLQDVGGGHWRCPSSGTDFVERDGALEEVAT